MAASDEDPSSRPEGRGERLVTALDRRVQGASAGKAFLRKAFPDHWSFPLGEPALYSMVVTGVWLC
ncbi:hypothetical protein [Streptomyces collinus]|uniref:hypothetical protein n=1 Tax=Streptomyces collinus TaxID=42684 RepID=UPI0038084BC7